MAQKSILDLANIDTNDFENIKLIKPSELFNLFSVRHKFSKKNFVAMVIKRIKSDVNYEQNIINHIFLMMSTQHLTTKKFYGFSSTDFNEQNNITIFMKIYNQKSIFDYIEEKRRSLSNFTFDNTTRLIILIGIAYSLNYFNQNTIFKCDDQFPNIFLDKHFRPHICDSILSIFNGQYQHNPKGFDNIIYKSPENMFCSIEYTSVSDEKSFVYSIGILIYEILSGQIPYQSYQEGKLTQFQLKLKVSKENYRPSLDCPLSEHAKNLINRCLSSKPKNRPTFLEIFNELTNFDSKNESKIISNVNNDEVINYISEITIKTPTYETLIEQLTKYKLKLSSVNQLQCLYEICQESYENNDVQLRKASFENYCRIKKSFLKAHNFYKEKDTFNVIRYLYYNVDLIYPNVVPYIVFNLAQKFDKSIETTSAMVDQYPTFSKKCKEWIQNEIEHLISICLKSKISQQVPNQSDQRFIVDFSNKILVVSIGLNLFDCENDFSPYEMSDFIDNDEVMIEQQNEEIDKFIRDYEYYKFIAPAEPENDEDESENNESEEPEESENEEQENGDNYDNIIS